MPILPTDTNDTPNYTPTEHATHHNVLAGLNNELGNFVQATAAPGSPAAGDLWLDTDEVAQSGTLGRLGYVKATANQGSITTEVDLTSLTVTVDVAANRLIKITGKGAFSSTVAADKADLIVHQDGAQVDIYRNNIQQTGTAYGGWVTAIVEAPSAGSHTYKLRCARQGTGTVTLNAAATNPAWILVEDIGASP